MRTVWKAKLHIGEPIPMPRGAKVLCVQVQGGDPAVWYECDPSMPLEDRRFNIYGTGHTIELEPGKYVGTFQLPKFDLVFHVYEADQ